jgi:hypothetical protein
MDAIPACVRLVTACPTKPIGMKLLACQWLYDVGWIDI